MGDESMNATCVSPPVSCMEFILGDLAAARPGQIVPELDRTRLSVVERSSLQNSVISYRDARAPDFGNCLIAAPLLSSGTPITALYKTTG